jgi:hypothetical protein
MEREETPIKHQKHHETECPFAIHLRRRRGAGGTVTGSIHPAIGNSGRVGMLFAQLPPDRKLNQHQ